MPQLLEYLSTMSPGEIADVGQLDSLLAGCWDQFDGGNVEGMEAYKLLGRWVIDLSLDRFEGVDKIIARRAMARKVLRVNEACARLSTDTAEACLKERLTHLSL